MERVWKPRRNAVPIPLNCLQKLIDIRKCCADRRSKLSVGAQKDKIIRETVRGAVLYAFGKLHHIFPCNIRSQVAADDDAAVKYNVQVAEGKGQVIQIVLPYRCKRGISTAQLPENGGDIRLRRPFQTCLLYTSRCV